MAGCWRYGEFINNQGWASGNRKQKQNPKTKKNTQIQATGTHPGN
jgi:hypothetical protein